MVPAHEADFVQQSSTPLLSPLPLSSLLLLSCMGECVIAAGKRCQIPTAVLSAAHRRRHPGWEYSVSHFPSLPCLADGNNLTLCSKNVFHPSSVCWCMLATLLPPLNWSTYFPWESQDGLSGLSGFSVGLTQLSLAGECVCLFVCM